MAFFDPRKQSDREFQQMQQNQQQIRDQMRSAGASNAEITAAVNQYADQWRQGGGGVPAPVSASYGGVPTLGGTTGTTTGAAAEPSPFDKMLDIYEQSFAEAKEANESRYAEARALQEGMGEQEAADIRESFRGLGTSAGQDLVSRGLTGTTIAPTVQAGIKREESSALGRLGERIRGEKIGLIERRQDVYPDMATLLQIGQMAGSAGYGGAAAGAAGQPGQNIVGGMDLSGLTNLASSGASLHVGGGSTRPSASPTGGGGSLAGTGRAYEYGGSPLANMSTTEYQRRLRAYGSGLGLREGGVPTPSPGDLFQAGRGGNPRPGATPISARARAQFGWG